MAKKRKKKSKVKDGMMKKVAGKNFEKYENSDPEIKSDASTETVVQPVNKDTWNRADNMLKNLTTNTGIPRQKVRMK